MQTLRISESRDKTAVKAYIDKLPEGKRYDVIIKLHREKRTLSQNNLFHLWVSCIASETGENKDRIKVALKEMFLGYRTHTTFGHTSYALPSTTELDAKQMSDFMNQVHSFAAAELGIVLPLPEDEYFYQFVEQFKNNI